MEPLDKVMRMLEKMKARHKVVCGNGYVHEGYRQACDDALTGTGRIKDMVARATSNNVGAPTTSPNTGCMVSLGYTQTCPRCNGLGKVRPPCELCGDTGMVVEDNSGTAYGMKPCPNGCPRPVGRLHTA